MFQLKTFTNFQLNILITNTLFQNITSYFYIKNNVFVEVLIMVNKQFEFYLNEIDNLKIRSAVKLGYCICKNNKL